MTSIITGDIVNSRDVATQLWIPILKSVLNKYGVEPTQWEIFRGDSFQLEVQPTEALLACLLIKATVKTIKGLDVRLAIGIGEKSYSSDKITASNGSAFINSGVCYDGLKKSSLAIKSANAEFDTQLNLLFDLAQLAMNSWTQKSSEMVKISIENPNATQTDLAELVQKSQSTISESLKTAGYEEVMKLENYYRNQITKLW